ncbi:YeiH family protein [Psychrilyobacter atlanticus]|uniref:YeiH family protein n=1 Tax=Psychrilyobacter atlanticus TaxID=271091 RepID=UPI000404C564|nr:putative sulfate exporter family transporter [Psychrilyobacter atlanticus]
MNIKKIIPGFIVCSVIAYIGSVLGGIFPKLGGASFAIILGIILGNTLVKNEKFAAGSVFSESNLLSYSIVLLGGTLNIYSVFSVGVKGVSFIILQMVITVAAALWIGKKMKFEKKFTYLMGSGNAVCGSSAIGAVSPVVKPEKSDLGISITIVNLVGTVLMFLLPFISRVIFHGDTVMTSALIGGILQSVGQVIGAGQLVNNEVLELATIFKIIRIIFIVVLVTYLGKKVSADSKMAELEKEVEIEVEVEVNEATLEGSKKNGFKKLNIPWYITGFFIFTTLKTLGIFNGDLSNIFHFISSKFEIIALAGIGMRVKLSTLFSQGPKAITYGLAIGIIQVVAAITLIKIMYGLNF